MRKSLYLYLFIAAVLINVFTYAYFTKNLTFEKNRYDKFSKKMSDSLLVSYNNNIDANYFSLPYNENARNYLEQYDTAELVPRIKDKIMELNDNPQGNALLPYGKINDQKFIINKIQVLNHRWIIADFSDGKIWGEVLIKYFMEEDGNITFETIESLLYK
jgi:hypothetical protein